MPTNLENSAGATGLEKVSFHSNPKERQCQRMLKLPHNALISHASKVILKILQARLQQYVNHELPDVQAGFRKGRGPRTGKFGLGVQYEAGQTLTEFSQEKTLVIANTLFQQHRRQ